MSSRMRTFSALAAALVLAGCTSLIPKYERPALPVPDMPGLRPSGDRARETLFNWLGQDLAGWRVLDAFAGSGALGFEAASRGATEVLLLEIGAPALQRLFEALPGSLATVTANLAAMGTAAHALDGEDPHQALLRHIRHMFPGTGLADALDLIRQRDRGGSDLWCYRRSIHLLPHT